MLSLLLLHNYTVIAQLLVVSTDNNFSIYNVLDFHHHLLTEDHYN